MIPRCRRQPPSVDPIEMYVFYSYHKLQPRSPVHSGESWESRKDHSTVAMQLWLVGGVCVCVCVCVCVFSGGSAAVTACTAAAGYRGAPGAAAVACSSNTYCPAGAAAVTPCPANTVAPPLSAAATACVAAAGFYGQPGVAAYTCPQVCASARAHVNDYKRLCETMIMGSVSSAVRELTERAPALVSIRAGAVVLLCAPVLVRVNRHRSARSGGLCEK